MLAQSVVDVSVLSIDISSTMIDFSWVRLQRGRGARLGAAARPVPGAAARPQPRHGLPLHSHRRLPRLHPT